MIHSLQVQQLGSGAVGSALGGLHLGCRSRVHSYPLLFIYKSVKEGPRRGGGGAASTWSRLEKPPWYQWRRLDKDMESLLSRL